MLLDRTSLDKVKNKTKQNTKKTQPMNKLQDQTKISAEADKNQK